MADPLRIYATACAVIALLFGLTHLFLGMYERHAAGKLRRRAR